MVTVASPRFMVDMVINFTGLHKWVCLSFGHIFPSATRWCAQGIPWEDPCVKSLQLVPILVELQIHNTSCSDGRRGHQSSCHVLSKNLFLDTTESTSQSTGARITWPNEVLVSPFAYLACKCQAISCKIMLIKLYRMYVVSQRVAGFLAACWFTDFAHCLLPLTKFDLVCLRKSTARWGWLQQSDAAGIGW